MSSYVMDAPWLGLLFYTGVVFASIFPMVLSVTGQERRGEQGGMTALSPKKRIRRAISGVFLFAMGMRCPS
ncbi:hypothetical protein O9H85_00940 [Paenibacillus filicis]|uniref:DUF2182 domain-containing protein n=1 Tax=Paenibacillus gyeongsangnamensis TaxID=3388067 RepID=A0ABT4Q2H9_9BACL|nr:hypothetical protein [Paenibacillus filicis]MCZ8511022.1 hypothetical protein [Paenibacillus filicis]